MTTIGDVFAIIATLIGIGATSWALIVCCALLAPVRVNRARISAETNLAANMGFGVLLLIPGLFSVIALGTPHPLLKVLGWVTLLCILSVGAIGASGLAFLAAGRLRMLSPALDEYPAFLRGAGFMVSASMFPILGWFMLGPCLLLASLGGGARALVGKTVPPRVNGYYEAM